MFVASRYGSLPNEHMADCYYCRQVRSWFLHSPVYFGQSKKLKCWRCQFTHFSYEEGGLDYRAWLYYPCGWWEEREDICECRYFDRLGNELRNEGRFCLVPRYDPAEIYDDILGRYITMPGEDIYEGDLYFIETMRDLQICNIEAPQGVEFCGVAHAPLEFEGVALKYGILGISDIVSSQPFDKLYKFAKNFVLNTLPRLASLRNKHLIVKYLHWSEVRHLTRLNSSIRHILGSEAVDVRSLTEHLFCVFSKQRDRIPEESMNP